MWKIYKIFCTVSGKSYIGITKQKTKYRWRGHVSTARRGSPVLLSRAIRKYGEHAFQMRLLEIAETFENAGLIERQLIAEHKTLWPYGYNLTSGGEGIWGRRVTEEARIRMSASAKARDPATRKLSAEMRRAISISRSETLAKRPDLRAAIGDWNRGRVRSQAQRKRISASLRRSFRTNANQGELF